MCSYFTLLHSTRHYGNTPNPSETKQNRNQWDIGLFKFYPLYQFPEKACKLLNRWLFSLSYIKKYVIGEVLK